MYGVCMCGAICGDIRGGFPVQLCPCVRQSNVRHPGLVVGLHCAWNDRTGMRYGQKAQHLHRVVRAAMDTEPKKGSRRK